MKATSTAFALLFALVSIPASCANVPLGGDAPPSRSSAPVTPATTADWDQVNPSGESVLYARDGSPVRRTSEESTLTPGDQAPPQRSVSDTSGSRPYLLELYQQAVSEKDRLKLEVTALNQELTRADEGFRELERELEQMRDQYKLLQGERDEIQQQNFELAGRLTTAQIRRLESEKLLLETIIEQRRQNRAEQQKKASLSDDEPANGFITPDGEKQEG